MFYLLNSLLVTVLQLVVFCFVGLAVNGALKAFGFIVNSMYVTAFLYVGWNIIESFKTISSGREWVVVFGIIIRVAVGAGIVWLVGGPYLAMIKNGELAHAVVYLVAVAVFAGAGYTLTRRPSHS